MLSEWEGFYLLTGSAGAALIGLLFDSYGWPVAVGGVFVALALAMVLGLGLRQRSVS